MIECKSLVNIVFKTLIIMLVSFIILIKCLVFK
jgi:hypothetical protein